MNTFLSCWGITYVEWYENELQPKVLIQKQTNNILVKFCVVKKDDNSTMSIESFISFINKTTFLDEPSVAVLKNKIVNADFDGALESKKRRRYVLNNEKKRNSFWK